MNNVLIVLDSKKYATKEDEIKIKIQRRCTPSFYYTDYENSFIKFLHGIKVVGNFLSHIAYWLISLLSAWKIYSKRHNSSYKIFINPLVGIFYCFLLSMYNKHDSVCVSGFIFSDKKNKLYLYLREIFVNYSYKKAHKIIVYSSNEVELYSHRFPKLASNFIFIKYGRDFDIFEETEFVCSDRYIASGGSSNRDYTTLARALKHLAKKNITEKCKIATRTGTSLEQNLPANLEILYNIRMDKFGSFLDKSMFVVIPIINSGVSGGHMALLEAMSRSKLIIITDISVIRDYVDEESVIFYKADDSEDLANKIEYVLMNLDKSCLFDKAEYANKLYLDEYNFSSLIIRLVDEALR